MILVTEIGDKTFFIAAVLAMRYDRILVFAGAIGELHTSFSPSHASLLCMSNKIVADGELGI